MYFVKSLVMSLSSSWSSWTCIFVNPLFLVQCDNVPQTVPFSLQNGHRVARVLDCHGWLKMAARSLTSFSSRDGASFSSPEIQAGLWLFWWTFMGEAMCITSSCSIWPLKRSQGSGDRCSIRWPGPWGYHDALSSHWAYLNYSTQTVLPMEEIKSQRTEGYTRSKGQASVNRAVPHQPSAR